MKKTIITTFAIASMMFTATSCAEKSIDPISEVAKTETEVVAPIVGEAPDEEVEISGAAAAATASAHGRGLAFLAYDKYAAIPLAKTPAVKILTSVDLSGYFPTPSCQHQLASCVGFAASYVKAYQENKQRNVKTFVFSPSYIFNQIKLGGDCMSGAYIQDALKIMSTQGVCLESDFKYNGNTCASMPTTSLKQKASLYKIASYGRVNLTLNDLKAHLSEGTPVITSMLIDNAFDNYKSGVFSAWDGKNASGQALVIVGYNDATQSFKLINSWGTGWGENGFIRISYAALLAKLQGAYVSADLK